MDWLDFAKQYSFVFLIASLFFGGIAAGVMAPPASATGTYNLPSASVTGGNITDAQWSYDPYNDLWHVTLVGGASYYRMLVTLPDQKINTAEGTYKVPNYTVSLDFSKMNFGLPMDHSGDIPVYEFVDCGTKQISVSNWGTLLSAIGAALGPGGLLTGAALGNYLDNAEVAAQYNQARLECISTVERQIQSHNYVNPDYVLFVSFDPRDVPGILGSSIGSYTVADPHFYAVLWHYVPKWTPRVSASGWMPVGSVTVNLMSVKGAYSADVLLNSPASKDSQKATYVAQLGPWGTVRYVGYFQSSSDLYGLPDPNVILWDGKYSVVTDEALASYVSQVSSFQNALQNYKAYELGTNEDWRDFLSKHMGFITRSDVLTLAKESEQVRSDLLMDISAQHKTLDDAVSRSPWSKYVLSADDVKSKGLLVARRPENSVIRVVLSMDLNAEAIGLQVISPEGVIDSVNPNPVPVSRDGRVSFSFTVKNTSHDVKGAFNWKVTCSDGSTVASGVTQEIPPGGVYNVPVNGYVSYLKDAARPTTLKCTAELYSMKGKLLSSHAVYLQYQPEVVCAYSFPTCDSNGLGYWYCNDKYHPPVFVSCPQGQICQQNVDGAVCVTPTKETNTPLELNASTSFCSGDQICYVQGTQKVCKPCPEGGHCTYIRGQGAKCTGSVTPTPSPEVKGVVLSPVDKAKIELWRLGAGIAAIGSLLIWVVLA